MSKTDEKKYQKIYKYEGDEECDRLLNKFISCERNSGHFNLCEDIKLEYLQCRKKWNEIYEENAEKMMIKTKLLYFDNNKGVQGYNVKGS
jgi:hypothetical protein